MTLKIFNFNWGHCWLALLLVTIIIVNLKSAISIENNSGRSSFGTNRAKRQLSLPSTDFLNSLLNDVQNTTNDLLGNVNGLLANITNGLRIRNRRDTGDNSADRFKRQLSAPSTNFLNQLTNDAQNSTNDLLSNMNGMLANLTNGMQIRGRRNTGHNSADRLKRQLSLPSTGFLDQLTNNAQNTTNDLLSNMNGLLANLTNGLQIRSRRNTGNNSADRLKRQLSPTSTDFINQLANNSQNTEDNSADRLKRQLSLPSTGFLDQLTNDAQNSTNDLLSNVNGLMANLTNGLRIRGRRNIGDNSVNRAKRQLSLPSTGFLDQLTNDAQNSTNDLLSNVNGLMANLTNGLRIRGRRNIGDNSVNRAKRQLSLPSTGFLEQLMNEVRNSTDDLLSNMRRLVANVTNGIQFRSRYSHHHRGDSISTTRHPLFSNSTLSSNNSLSLSNQSTTPRSQSSSTSSVNRSKRQLQPPSSNSIKQLLGNVQDATNNLLNEMNQLQDRLNDSGLTQQLSDQINNQLNQINSTISQLLNTLGPIVDSVQDLVQSLGTMLGPMLGQILQPVLSTLAQTVASLGNLLSGLIKSQMSLANQLMDNSNNLTGPLVENIMNSVSNLSNRLNIVVDKTAADLPTMVNTVSMVPILNLLDDLLDNVDQSTNEVQSSMQQLSQQQMGQSEKIANNLLDSSDSQLADVENILSELQDNMNPDSEQFEIVQNILDRTSSIRDQFNSNQ